MTKKLALTLDNITSELERHLEEAEYLINILEQHEYLPAVIDARIDTIHPVITTTLKIIKGLRVDMKVFIIEADKRLKKNRKEE